MLDMPEMDWDDLGLGSSGLWSELSVVVVVEGVVSSAELIDSRYDRTVGGLVEDIETRGEAYPVGWSMACASRTEEEERSEPLELHLVLSLDTRASVSILCRQAAEAL